MTIPIFTLEQLGVPIRIAQLARELHARRLTDLNILHDSSPVFLDVVGEHATWRCDNQSVAFATLEARNQCVAALAHSEWCAGRNAEDHKGLFDTAHMLWRNEIGHSDQASGRFLALAHSTTNIFTSAAARLADADSKVFDVLHAVGAAIGYLDSFEPADLIALVEAQYEKTKRDMASGLLFNTIEQAIARDPTTCRALNTAVKEKATVPISGLYQTTLLALARAGELDEAVATAMRDTQSQDPLVQQLAHWSIALLLAQYEIPESTQDRCVELLRVACRSAPIAPIGDRPRLSPENNRGLSPIVPTNANVGGSYTYNYNGAGELLSQTDPKSQVTKQQYDAVGRMTERDEHGTTSTWAYDDCGKGIGKLCSTSKVGASHVYVYDAQARTQQVKTTIDNQEFVRTTLYNPKGQLSYVGYPQTEPGQQPLGLTTTYNVHGFADKVQRTGAVDPYWTATARYDDGSFASGTNGAAPYEKDYDVLGRLSVVRLRSAQSALVHTSNYSYDKIGNLTSRAQQPASVGPQNAERFCYDSLNRVTHASVGTGIECSAAAQYIYSVDGNLTTKNGATGAVGTITYGTAGRANGAGPHAVATANGRTFVYDANGNFTGYVSDATRTITYTPFNLPTTITGNNPLISGLTGTTSLSYVYDTAHARVKDVAVLPDQSTHTTLHASSGFFEKASAPGGDTEYRHYMSGPDGTIGVHTVYVTPSGTISTARKYWLKDHLGSPVAEYAHGITSPMTPMGFDTWGLRRKGFDTTQLTSGDLDGFSSPRGFTGHEHMDEVGLVHMNGRIYDPVIGRFLQPDPIVQETYNSQNFNRYSYVLNNPLAYTDPTGYSFWTEVRRPVAAIAVAVATYGVGTYFATGVLFAPAATLTTGQSFAIAVASGFASGGVGGGNIQSAIQGAFTAALFFGVGELNLTTGGAGNIAAHAAAGCVNAGLQGGNCRAGALSAGFAEFAGPKLLTGKMIADTVVHATLGGVGAMIGGGKFGNGAVTGAFGYLFNYCSHGNCTSKLEQAMYDYWPGYKAGTLLYNQTMGDGSWTGWEVVDAVSVGAGAAGKGLQALQGLRAGAAGIEFGANANQVSHAFRHIDDLGLARDAVATAIRTDMSAASLQVGQGVTRSVTVNGIDLTYRAHRYSESAINIGRITGP